MDRFIAFGYLASSTTTVYWAAMRKFLRDQSLRDFEFSEEYAQHFKDVTDRLHQRKAGLFKLIQLTVNCPL